MKTRLLITVAVALGLLGALFAFKFARDRRYYAAMAARAIPPVTVSTAVAEATSWPNTINAVGSVVSYRGITVKTELEGVVRRVVAQSGGTVGEGAPLVELDTSVEEAQLAGLDAQALLAGQELERARELRGNGTNTPADLDRAEATLKQARAAVGQLRATIAKKHIVAPFAGRLGIVRVYPGQMLARSDIIVELEALDRVYADFTVPQQELGRLAVGEPVRVRVDAHPDRAFEGVIEAVSPRVNEGARTLSVRAVLPNRDEALLPGMFGNVEVELPSTDNAVAVPTAAVVYNPYGNFVYIVENGAAKQRFVQTGHARGSVVAISEGLKPGEPVVTSGQIKLRNGSPVRVDNQVTPSANPTPKPSEG